MVILEILELFGTFESPVAYGCNNLEIRCQGSKRDLESHLIVAGGGAAMCHRGGFERQSHLRDGLGLQHALGADAQRIQSTTANIAHDEEFEYLVEIRAACIDQMMLDRPEFGRAATQALRSRGVDTAGIDGYGDDRASVGVLEPWHAERGVQAA